MDGKWFVFDEYDTRVDERRRSRPILITDKQGRVIVILAGRPVHDRTWNSDVEEVQAALARAQDALDFRGFQSLSVDEAI